MMNDTFLNTLLQLSEKEKREERRPQSGQRPGSVLFSRPPSSLLVSRPPSDAYGGRVHKRPPSTSTLRPRPASGNAPLARPPSVSTIASTKAPSSTVLKRPNPVKCNVCTEGFTFFSNTPCFDNYCVQCLEDHILSFKRGTGCDCLLCKSGILLPAKPKFEFESRRDRSVTSGLNVCNVCNNSRLAQYRCNSCEEFFCERCNKDFLKRMRIDSLFNNEQVADIMTDHSIPGIGPIGMDDESFDSISLPALLPKSFGLRCKDHDEEELRFHCKSCDKPICRDCKILDHEGHETLALEDVYEDRKHHLNQAIKLSNANIRKLHAEVSIINSKRLDIDQESRDAISQIENHANEAKRMIDELSKTMIKTIRSQNAQSRGKLENSREIVKDKVKMIQGLVEKGTELYNSENAMDIIDQAPQLTKVLNEADITPTAERQWRKKFVFQPTDLKTMAPHVMFGKLQALIEGLIKDVPYVDLEILSTFSTNTKEKVTTAMAPMSDGSVWICNGYRNTIQRFNIQGEQLQSEILDFDVDDMVDGTAGKLFFTELNGKIIRKLHNNKLSVFARTDLYLRGITMSKDTKYAITCGNDVPVACLREAEVSKIFVHSMSGRVIRQINVSMGTRGVSLYRICHTINEEYIVSTGVSAQYYIIGENGDFRFRYKASHTADGVSSDSHGLIYLSSCKDDTLYILNCKGVPIPSTYAMHKPNAVAIDKDDKIWVGDWNKIHVLGYKN